MTQPSAGELPDPEFDVDEEDKPEAPALAIGFEIGGKYTIKRVLGVGGDGAVYEAAHKEIGHLVAIKVAHPSRSDREDIMERFRREARICGSLRHPHVGQIYDVGKLKDGSPYMVMELQEGRSLADVIDETVLPLAAVLDIVRQVLAGLGAAHQMGIVHRDVKPDNVMLVRDRSGEVVAKLVDFGISKSLASTDREVTGEGIIVGSPDYMPPEQLRGDAIDIRTDTYAVGVLLYEALTRHTPFDAGNIPELVAAILRDPVKSPRELRFDCPPELERVVLKAMSRDPDMRYQTADHLSRALGELQKLLSRRTGEPQLAMLAAPITDPSAPKRTRHKRTIDNRTLVMMGVQKPPAPQAKGWTLRDLKSSPRRLAVLGGGAIAALLLGIWFGASPTVSRPRSVAKQPPFVELPPPAAAQHAAPAKRPAPKADMVFELPEATAPAAAGAAPRTGKRPARGAIVRKPAPTEAPAAVAKPAPVAAAPPPEVPAADPSLLKQAATAFVVGETEHARDLYRQVTVRSPREADAWRGLGLTSARLGQSAEAARAFKRYLELKPDARDGDRIREMLSKQN